MVQRKKSYHKFSWYLIWFVIFSFFLGAVLLLISTLPIWQVASIEVKGTRFLEKEEVKRIAEGSLGKNIFLVDVRAMSEKADNIPLIKSVRVKRVLPDTLAIEVLEREEVAVAIVDDQTMPSGRQAVLFDEEGMILNPAFIKYSPSSISNLAVIVGVKSRYISNGKLQKNIKQLLSHLLKDLKNYSSTERIKIDISFPQDIVLLVDDIIRVRIGKAAQIDKKFKAFKVLRDFEEHRLNSIEYIDVRLLENPVIKFK